MVGVMQVLSQAEVVQHVLSNVTPLDERRLEATDDLVQWEMEPVSHGLGKELHIWVKEGDGAKSHQQICGATRLVHGADQALQQGLQRRLLRGGKGLIEHLHEDRADLLPHGHIELVGPTIQPRSFPSLAAHERTEQLLLNHTGRTRDTAAQRSFSSSGLARGRSLVKAPQNGSTDRRVQPLLAPEDAGSTVPREIVDSHGELVIGQTFGPGMPVVGMPVVVTRAWPL